MHVVIVGGSLCGLFCGIVLKRLGHVVRILERNPTPLLHNQGAGIVAGGDVQAFFERYDRTRHGIAVSSHARQHLNRRGHVVHRENYPQSMTSWDLLYHLLRANFDGYDCGYVKVPRALPSEGQASYEYGKLVKSIRQDGKELEIQYTDVEGAEHTVRADFVLAADGASSAIRRQLMPHIERRYAGYIAWRGTVAENEASPLLKETFVDRFTFYSELGIQILAYLIPGFKGTRNPEERLINWVWYNNYPEELSAYAKVMTDSSGKKHRVTLPVGQVQPGVWAEQKQYAHDVLPPPFAALVSSTAQPFVQAITDVKATSMSAMEGKLLLVGDALAGFRPHTAASTSQAAFHALLLQRLFDGELDLADMERMAMRNADVTSSSGIRMGDMSQFG